MVDWVGVPQLGLCDKLFLLPNSLQRNGYLRGDESSQWPFWHCGRGYTASIRWRTPSMDQQQLYTSFWGCQDRPSQLAVGIWSWREYYCFFSPLLDHYSLLLNSRFNLNYRPFCWCTPGSGDKQFLNSGGQIFSYALALTFSPGAT